MICRQCKEAEVTSLFRKRCNACLAVLHAEHMARREAQEALTDNETMAELEALIAEQLPTMPGNDEDPHPELPPEVVASVFPPMVSTGELHHSTEPAAIAATQRKLVSTYFDWLPDATTAQASDALDLPTFSIELRLAELRGLPVPMRPGGDTVNAPMGWDYKKNEVTARWQKKRTQAS